MRLIERIQQDHARLVEQANLQRAEEELHTDVVPTSIIDLLGYALENYVVRVSDMKADLGSPDRHAKHPEEATKRSQINLRYDHRRSFDEPFLTFDNTAGPIIGTGKHPGYDSYPVFGAFLDDLKEGQPGFSEIYMDLNNQSSDETAKMMRKMNVLTQIQNDAYLDRALDSLGRVNPHTQPTLYDLASAKLEILGAEFSTKHEVRLYGGRFVPSKQTSSK